MTRGTTTAIGIAATVLLVPALLSACSTSGAGSASSPDRGTATRSEVDAKIASCIRDKGYDVTDENWQKYPPGVDHGAFDRDQGACIDEHDAGGGAQELRPDDPAAVERARKTAECMRDAGYADFPDGVAEQGTFQPSGDTKPFLDALNTCLGAAGGGVAVTR